MAEASTAKVDEATCSMSVVKFEAEKKITLVKNVLKPGPMCHTLEDLFNDSIINVSEDDLSDEIIDKYQKVAYITVSRSQMGKHFIQTTQKKYSSVFRENRCPPPPKPVYGGNFCHEAVSLKIRSRSPESNKLLILSDLDRLANLVTFHPMVGQRSG